MDLGGTKKASSKAAELFGREQRSHHACLGSDSLVRPFSDPTR